MTDCGKCYEFKTDREIDMGANVLSSDNVRCLKLSYAKGRKTINPFMRLVY